MPLPQGARMKKDGELLLDERSKGTKQKLAAARVGVCERTARKYERIGKLPSQMKKPRGQDKRRRRCGGRTGALED